MSGPSGEASRRRLQAALSHTEDPAIANPATTAPTTWVPMAARTQGEQGPTTEQDAVLRAAARLGRPRPWLPLLVLAAVALVIAGAVWWRGQSRTMPQHLEVENPGAPVMPETSAGSPAPTGRVTVDVAGKVRRPGIVTLPGGSRVAEAITAAGGVQPGTTTEGVNLARKLSDGEQIRVGAPAADPNISAPAPTGVDPTADNVTLDLNSATADQLDELPRIGPATAAKIVDFRRIHGPFRSVDQLLDVPGIGEATLAGIRARLHT